MIRFRFMTAAMAMTVAISGAACGKTMQGVKQDTERNVEKVAAGTETVDVKSALMADGRVDASNINVDTIASTKTVILKGSVPNAQQRTTAESIAREQAKGYAVNNQLTIAP